MSGAHSSFVQLHASRYGPSVGENTGPGIDALNSILSKLDGLQRIIDQAAVEPPPVTAPKAWEVQQPVAEGEGGGAETAEKVNEGEGEGEAGDAEDAAAAAPSGSADDTPLAWTQRGNEWYHRASSVESSSAPYPVRAFPMFTVDLRPAKIALSARIAALRSEIMQGVAANHRDELDKQVRRHSRPAVPIVAARGVGVGRRRCRVCVRWEGGGEGHRCVSPF